MNLPAGACPLTADELGAILSAGDHPESKAAPEADAVLVDLVRAGVLVACRLNDGRVGFSRPDGS